MSRNGANVQHFRGFPIGKVIIGRLSKREGDGGSPGGDLIFSTQRISGGPGSDFLYTKNFRAAGIDFYLHKEFRVAGSRFYLHKDFLCVEILCLRTPRRRDPRFCRQRNRFKNRSVVHFRIKNAQHAPSDELSKWHCI